MDPNANQKEQLELARELQFATGRGDVVSEVDVARLAELVLALDEWLQKGGFYPERWRPRYNQLVAENNLLRERAREADRGQEYGGYPGGNKPGFGDMGG